MSFGVGRVLGELRGVTNDVVFDHHLGRGGDEDVKARLAGGQAEFERATCHARDELEKTVTFPRRLGQDVRIGAR